MKEDIPIYVISLPSDVVRRENMKKQFPESYKYFEFIEAIDFRGREKNEINHLYKECKQNMKRPLTPTEVACSLSHQKAIDHFLRSGNEWCVILEDDILGKDSGMYKIKHTIQRNAGADFFLFGGQDGMKNAKYIFGTIEKDDIWRLNKISLTFCTRACCYAISRQTAVHFHEISKNCTDRADIWERKLKPLESIFFVDIIKHPSNLEQSHLEAQRQADGDGLFYKLRQDGILKTTLRNAKKIILLGMYALNLGQFPLRSAKKKGV